jgi:hypothetical protein
VQPVEASTSSSTRRRTMEHLLHAQRSTHPG